MDEKAVYFISDLHLGAEYIADHREHERRVVNFLERISSQASHVYLVGDILDYWFEYKHVVPKGFTRFFGALAKLTDSGVKVTWLLGNHDIWLHDYFTKELCIEVLDGVLEREIQGKRLFITHGDGVGHLKPSFRLIRSLFRNPLCQKLYSSIHPRWTIPLAHRWSTKNRCSHPVPHPYLGIDREPLLLFAKEDQSRRPGHIDHYIFGHRHIAVHEQLPNTRTTVTILGEWIDKSTYAIMKNGVLTLIS